MHTTHSLCVSLYMLQPQSQPNVSDCCSVPLRPKAIANVSGVGTTSTATICSVPYVLAAALVFKVHSPQRMETGSP
jgi:hypothetical protein